MYIGSFLSTSARTKEAEAESKVSGVLAYTPLMSKLEGITESEKINQIASRSLPMALLCAIQDIGCLSDIRRVGDQYADLIPTIIGSDIALRKHEKYSEWMEYESNEYKIFIKESYDRILKK